MRNNCQLFFPLYHAISVLIFFAFSSCSTPNNTTDTDPVANSAQKVELPCNSQMWMLPQIEEAFDSCIQKENFSLSPEAFYDPKKPALNQAVVRINMHGNQAGTGSFISSKGLILTNHSIAYQAISRASSAEENYLRKGFYANSFQHEIPMPKYNLYIAVEQREVTDQIERRLADTLTYRERFRRSREIRKLLIAERKQGNDDLVVEIKDYWSGNRQFMSVYKVIRDVRLVHAPPLSISNPEINNDSPQRPRFAGDYALLRAYVSPEGESKIYSSTNVPFNPTQHFDLATDGISENDLTVVLGFPDKTFRQESSYALEFYRNIRNPVLIDSYQAILDGLDYEASGDSQPTLENTAKRASLAETLKYYRGVQRAFERQDIIEKKRSREQNFSDWIEKDSLRNLHYRRVLSQLEQAYRIASQTGDLLHATVYTLNNSRLFQIASIYDSYRHILEDSTQKKISQAFRDSLLTKHQEILGMTGIDAQQAMLTGMLHMLSTLPDGKIIFHLVELFGDAGREQLKKEIITYLRKQRRQSIIYDLGKAKAFLNLPPDSARQKPVDEFVVLYRALIESYRFSKKNYVQHVAYQKPAQERYVKGMKEFLPGHYRSPDANGTLRWSTGHIEGYRSDGRYHAPITTLVDMPKEAAPLSSQPVSKSDESLNVNFLITNDGSPSGSPVLNGKGELAGITFDRTVESAGNEFYHSEQSRIISVDIQYINFLMNNIFVTERLTEEINEEDFSK